MDKKMDTQVPIGIDAIAFSIPRGYVSLTDLAEARGVPMPGFFGYMAWSGLILLPVFVLLTFLFF